jgi:AcrR family transcriptional regulator
MTQGTIYNYVSSKDDILYLVCDRIVAEYNEQARRALDTSHDPVGRVRSAVRAISQVMYRHRREILLNSSVAAHPMAPRRRQTSSPLS